MALTINNTNTGMLLNILNRNSVAQSNTFRQLATGKRINEAETLMKIAHEMDKGGDVEQAVRFGHKARGLYEDLFLPERNKVAAQVSVWEAALPKEESDSPAEIEPAKQVEPADQV